MLREQDIIAIYNFKQACAYIKNGVQPIYLEYGNKGDLIFYFKKDMCQEAWEKWKAHKSGL